MINKIIRNYLIKQTVGRSDDGIMITLRDPQKVEMLENIMADLLMRNGIDPRAITSEAQLKGLLNQIEAMTKQSTTTGIRNTKSAKVFNTAGEELDPSKPIMGGTQEGKKINQDFFIRNAESQTPPPGSRGGPDDIAAPVQSSEETLKSMIEAENKKNIAKMKNRKMLDDAIENQSPGLTGDRKYDADIVAEDLAERMGLVYDDMPTKERLDLYDQAYQALTKKKFDPPEDMAQGGIARIGLKDGFTPDDKKTVGPVFTTNKIEDAAKEVVKRLIKLEGTNIPLSEKLSLSLGPDLNQAEISGVLSILGGDLSFGGGINEDKRGIGFNFRKQFEDGGRIGLKEGTGMTRRTFMKIFSGLVALPIIGKVLKPLKVGKTVTKVPIIKTDNVPGKPEWFDQLVNKVILEGDDVTKRFATKDREIVHMKKIDDDNTVTVTQDLDEGAVRVEYDSPANTFEDTVQLRYKKPNPDEGDPRPSAEFDVAESGPVGRVDGPDDFSLDVDEVGGTSIKDLDSDVSMLKQYATGKKPTMKELVQNIKRKDKAKNITEDLEAQSDAVIRRQGDYDPSYDDYASGGIARMLGE
jgi:hypothetical protein